MVPLSTPLVCPCIFHLEEATGNFVEGRTVSHRWYNGLQVFQMCERAFREVVLSCQLILGFDASAEKGLTDLKLCRIWTMPTTCFSFLRWKQMLWAGYHVPKRVYIVCVCECVCMPVCAQGWPRMWDGGIAISTFARLFSLDGLPVSLGGRVGEAMRGSEAWLYRLQSAPPPIPSQSHPQTWCTNGIGEMTLLSETVWSSKHTGVSGYSAEDQTWTFARAPQTSEVISNLKFYTLPFSHCFIHLLVIPTLCGFWCLLLSDWELRLWAP